MRLRSTQYLASLLVVILALPGRVRAFETPLSDTAVREAYFIGQRHDEYAAHFFDKYYRHLPPPKTGPYVSTIAFLTPYALLAQFSNRHTFGYNAQQAELDHRRMIETVKIVIGIQLTDSYPAVIPNPSGETTGTPWKYIHRSSDFWRDFGIQVLTGNKTLSPFVSTGEPNFVCGDVGPGGSLDEDCTLVGATVHLEFLADQFAPDSAMIRISPPGSDPMEVDFDLSALR